MNLIDLTKTELEKLYLEQNKTDLEIANLYNAKLFQICSLRKKFGIKGINARHRKLFDKPQIEISQRQMSIILGGLLGDASLKSRNGKTAYLSMSHSNKQYDYIKWKYKELKSISCKEPSSYTSHGKYTTWEFCTETRKDLNDLRNKIYTPVKTINQEWLDGLDELSIFIWYCDDGSLNYKNKIRSSFSFATNCFSTKENYLLINMLDNKFGIKSNIAPTKSGQNTIVVDDCSFNDFNELLIRNTFDPKFYKIYQPENNNKLVLDNLTDKTNKITKDVICELYNVKKMTQKQIAEAFGVHKSTITKLMHVYKIPTRDAAGCQLHGFTSKKLLELTEQQEIKAKDLFTQFRAKDFPYIEKKTNEHYFGVIDTLINNGPLVLNKYYSFMYSRCGMDIVSHFCPQIYRMATNGSLSPVEIFNDDEKLMDCIKRTIKYAKKDSVAAVRQGLKTYKKNRCVSSFPPMWAKHIIEFLFKDRINLNVLDFSCGFGGRLLGCYASKNVASYTGIDPLTDNINSNMEILKVIKMHNNLRHFKDFNVDLINKPAEDIMDSFLEANYDLVLTSPPYFNKEIYSDEATQCYNKYDSYRKWEQEWLKTILIKSFSKIKKSGKMIIFASNCNGNPVWDSCEHIMRTFCSHNIELLDFAIPSLEYFRKDEQIRVETAIIATKT